MPLPHVVARVNKRVTNRFIEPIARRSPGFAIAHHVGRVSGARFSTPLNVFDLDGDALIVLTYGLRADWVQNVLAGRGRLEQEGQIRPITSIHVVGRDDAWPHLPLMVRSALRFMRVRDFARLALGNAEPSASVDSGTVQHDQPPGPMPITATRSTPLGRWWLRNRWDELAFVHHAYEPAVVQALLPDGLLADTFDGQAWVSLVPFQIREATPRFLPPIPWVSDFVETNVRTYVIDRAGNRAVWFFSLEADRLAIVAFARLLLGFPYVWSKMHLERTDGARRYVTSRRRWPASPASATAVTVEIGDVIDEPSDLDVFLTARWGTVAKWPGARGTLRHHPVDHPVWTLREGALSEYDDTSFEAAGLPAPTSSPIVRYVDGIDARFGRPRRV